MSDAPLVYITGASSGIGQALAAHFHTAGWRLALVARRVAEVQAWATAQGYAPQRLRPLVHLAQARQAREQELRGALAELSDRFEERKLVDKAKGILMRARQLSEEEAFGLLRTASMHGNQRVGQVSRQVIDTAEVAEAINRAGQLRMLSQRLVKLSALACTKSEAAAAQTLLHSAHALPTSSASSKPQVACSL